MAGHALIRYVAVASPNCNQCTHLATSWDPRMPYCCRFFGFKSRTLPNAEVLRLDGEPCQGFMSKPARVSELRR